MSNYFMDTPVYKIWIDFINYLSPRASFIVSQKNYSFKYLKCTREEVIEVYENDEIQLEIVFALENRFFYCRKSDKISAGNITWTKEPPMIQKVNDFDELQVEIENWMQYLSKNL